MLQLERELVQARLKEAESQCALKEMQDKILDMEKVGVQEREALLQLQPSPCVTTRPIVQCDNQGRDGVIVAYVFKQQVFRVKSVILFTAAVKQSKGKLGATVPIIPSGPLSFVLWSLI